jgi:hypothetical protein
MIDALILIWCLCAGLAALGTIDKVIRMIANHNREVRVWKL